MENDEAYIDDIVNAESSIESCDQKLSINLEPNPDHKLCKHKLKEIIQERELNKRGLENDKNS